ncbi:MAG TPA: aminodeoxychorismate/anthranilate synthase component II [Bacteroidia bacterium]|nr:aminodeoxychorismate/anthranilate synthase component II [Bacteroidia bacterium]MBP7714907.1 aminodeoxychorismate/anthranilate synthase component II [Bacteroidia bacterium]MBP8668277.1 aminodeoxychorismate/anthranilate synthase component II [Bacteroidia bacterium]HOZ82985.1 aminodeoxychorismate/anthranilate synthase component II [Bacteroidia bacterium]HQW18356.1 aminodeoxychorismate/anthranilate synthase component II [Bacteroidia bacterium]
MKILVIDNYDSFTYNLVHYIEKAAGVQPTVWRNNSHSVDEVAAFDKICISPGPGVPSQAGFTKEVIKRFTSEKSILGVCLGHQAIAEVFGGSLRNLQQVLHGIVRPVNVLVQDVLFENMPSSFPAARYHSWVVDQTGSQLQVIAGDDIGEVMAIKHIQYPVYGVQFHPESIMTEHGLQLIYNWIYKT